MVNKAFVAEAFVKRLDRVSQRAGVQPPQGFQLLWG